VTVPQYFNSKKDTISKSIVKTGTALASDRRDEEYVPKSLQTLGD
jgi:hypothetical protein